MTETMSNMREDDTMADHALRRRLAPPRHAVNHSARPSRRTYVDNVQTFIVTRGGGIRKTAATAIGIMIVMLIILWNFRRLTINTQYTNPRNSDLKHDSAVICSIVSNEEFYLDEWIDYNLGIGFAKIYIYDNTKHFDLGHGWLDRRGARLANRVSIQHYPGEGKQGTAYSDCARQALLDGHRWAFCTDVDEFLVLKKHPDVTSFLMEHDTNRAALSINWQIHSWDNQMQFRPLPVTKRFVGKVTSRANIHVKTISNVDKMDLSASHHPHFPTLKGNHFSIDTNGDKVAVKWSNERYPSDVALIYHFNCKSWKEYIGKRSRGRAGTLTGKARDDSVAALIADARKGNGLSNTTEIDSSSWEMLKERNPKYRFFDTVDSKNEEKTENAWRSSIGVCCYAKDQEAYADEWVDYHLALGFSRLYVYDGSDEFWMQQWNEKRNETRLSLLHFPATGNHTNLDEKAKAYANCVGQHGNVHHAIVFLDVNDFLVLPKSAGNDPITPLLDQSAHAFQFERVLFGHNSQFVYDPLPVTKRFLRRVVNETAADIAPALLLQTKSKALTESALHSLESDLSLYLASGKFTSDIYPADPHTPENISVYHYLRSTKECNKERGDPALCNLKGSVEDRTAWEQMQYLVPWYANFNGLI